MFGNKKRSNTRVDSLVGHQTTLTGDVSFAGGLHVNGSILGNVSGDGDDDATLVPVAAILVASIRLHFLDVLLHLGRRGAHEMPCAAPHRKGEEMGWFEHGSTIIVFAPPGFEHSTSSPPPVDWNPWITTLPVAHMTCE